VGILEYQNVGDTQPKIVGKFFKTFMRIRLDGVKPKGNRVDGRVVPIIICGMLLMRLGGHLKLILSEGHLGGPSLHSSIS